MRSQSHFFLYNVHLTTIIKENLTIPETKIGLKTIYQRREESGQKHTNDILPVLLGLYP